MKRKLATDISDIAKATVKNKLLAAANLGMMPNHQLAYVVDVRDTLHDACCRFEADDAAELHSDLYLPLFESLSIVTSGLMLKKPIREIVPVALFALSDPTREQRE